MRGCKLTKMKYRFVETVEIDFEENAYQILKKNSSSKDLDAAANRTLNLLKILGLNTKSPTEILEKMKKKLLDITENSQLRDKLFKILASIGIASVIMFITKALAASATSLFVLWMLGLIVLHALLGYKLLTNAIEESLISSDYIRYKINSMYYFATDKIDKILGWIDHNYSISPKTVGILCFFLNLIFLYKIIV